VTETTPAPPVVEALPPAAPAPPARRTPTPTPVAAPAPAAVPATGPTDLPVTGPGGVAILAGLSLALAAAGLLLRRPPAGRQILISRPL
jgi:hypothetical protein